MVNYVKLDVRLAINGFKPIPCCKGTTHFQLLADEYIHWLEVISILYYFNMSRVKHTDVCIRISLLRTQNPERELQYGGGGEDPKAQNATVSTHSCVYSFFVHGDW